MQHHPRERPTWPLATVCPARLGPHQQALRLQKQLRPGVAPGELVVADKVFVKMPGREAAVARAIQGFHLPPRSQPEPACPIPRRAYGPTDRRLRLLRSDGTSGGTFVR